MADAQAANPTGKPDAAKPGEPAQAASTLASLLTAPANASATAGACREGFWRARRGPLRDPLAEYGLFPPLNTALRGVMTVERSLIRAGVRLPVGGSILLVARKPA